MSITLSATVIENPAVPDNTSPRVHGMLTMSGGGLQMIFCSSKCLLLLWPPNARSLGKLCHRKVYMLNHMNYCVHPCN